MCFCVCSHVYVGHLLGAGFLLPSYGSRGMSSGCQAWQQAFLYAKPPFWPAESFGREQGQPSYGGIEHSFNTKPLDKGLILAAWSWRLHFLILLLQGLSVDAAQQGRLSVKPQQCRIYKSQTETGTRIVVARAQRVQLGRYG